MKTIILETLPSINANLRNLMNRVPSPCRSFLVIACFAVLPKMQATPEEGPAAPEMALAGLNTADGDHALFSITTGVANTAIGWFSLRNNTDGSFNTAVGAGTLVLSIGDQTTGEGLENTAVGALALLFNTTGSNNTALGVLALENNTSGGGSTAVGVGALQQNTGIGSSTAVGFNALINNVDGFNNAAFGIRPMELNTSGGNNTAIGNLALSNSQTTNDHVCVGRLAGSGITTANNNVIIGHFSGVHPDPAFGQISDRCFIDNIHGAPVSSNFDPQPVMVDSTGRLGTFVLAAGAKDPGGFYPHGSPRQAVPQSVKPDTALNGRVEKLQATVAQQKKQIEVLTAQLKEQATQIQKVSAQLEVRKPATRTVENNR